MDSVAGFVSDDVPEAVEQQEEDNPPRWQGKVGTLI